MARQHKGGPLRLRVRDIKETGQALEFVIAKKELSEVVKAVDEAYEPTGGLRATFQLSRVGDNVFVKGNLSAELSFVCSRCLKKTVRPLDILLKWTFLPLKGLRYMTNAAGEETELTDDDLDVSFYEGETIDLLDVAREAVDLDLAPYPTCEQRCTGVWEQADEENSNGLDESNRVDPRWSGLLELTQKQHS